jgi:hypothetical protein
MITYLEYTDYSLVLHYICKKLKQESDFENSLISGKIPNVEKIKLQNIFEIEQYLASPDGLFEDSSDLVTNYLIDLQSIDITRQAEYLSLKLADYEGQVFIYSSEVEGVNADTKKNLKKYKIELETLKKIDPDTTSTLYSNYCNENQIQLTSSQIKTLVEQTISYHEIIDNLDFISMSGDLKTGYEALLKTQKPMLFMQGFNLDKLDYMPWYRNVDDNELQLALSLIFGKMDKSTSTDAQYIQQEVINTDQKIKTSSKLPSLTWFRLLLFKARSL